MLCEILLGCNIHKQTYIYNLPHNYLIQLPISEHILALFNMINAFTAYNYLQFYVIIILVVANYSKLSRRSVVIRNSKL